MNIKDFYKNKRVLITGHTGFKGSWLSEVLLECEASVCGIALEPCTEPALFNLINLKNKMESHIIDIRNYEKVKQVFDSFQPEIVIHLAAQPLVIDSYKEPRYTYDTNVMGTVNVCECIRLTPSIKSFINVTTDKVYENIEKENHKYKEDERLNGFDPYSNSKSCSELVTQSYMKSFYKDLPLSVSTCRAGNVIGGGDFSANRIIVDCVKCCIAKKPIVLRNPYSIRPYQHVLEADMFYLLLAMKQYDDKTFSGHYNIGPNDEDCITTGQIANLFVTKWGIGASTKIIDYNGPHEAKFLQLDTTKAQNILNWKPIWNVETAVDKVVEWSKVFENGGDLECITNAQIKEYMEEILDGYNSRR